MTSLDAELVREATHLDTSRAALHAMRARTEALTRSDAAGDPFSSEMLARALAHRMEQLLDDGTTPLFFGRLDFAPTGTQYADETFHVGRHITDAAGDPLVVDWRAGLHRVLPGGRARPAGRPATAAVRLRRRAAHLVRGRAPGLGRGVRARLAPAGRGDRAAARRSDA